MPMDRRPAKIVATLGPATSDAGTVERVLRAGAVVVRLNFSHGTFAEQGERIALVRRIAERLGLAVGVLQDLPGPKVRLGELPAGRVVSGRLTGIDWGVTRRVKKSRKIKAEPFLIII